MRRKGITYDTGFFPAGRTSRPIFEPAQVRHDLRAIARELRCDAVRVTGGDLDRLTVAAEYAAAEGLEVWYSPQPCELDSGQMRSLFEEAAGRAAEVASGSGSEVVLVLGCELSVLGRGFVPGDDAHARLASLTAPGPELLASYDSIAARLNGFLAAVAADARAAFGGAITYAAAPWEPIDWTPFDIVSVDAYRGSSNAAAYRGQIRALTAHGRPAAVTEFGCCTYRGAADRGAQGWTIVSGTGSQRRIDGPYVRDEGEQARYLVELLSLYEEEGIDSAFWFSFANYDKPRREEPSRDLDLASYGVVAVLDPDGGDGPWVAKQSFAALAGHDGRGSGSDSSSKPSRTAASSRSRSRG